MPSAYKLMPRCTACVCATALHRAPPRPLCTSQCTRGSWGAEQAVPRFLGRCRNPRSPFNLKHPSQKPCCYNQIEAETQSTR